MQPKSAEEIKDLLMRYYDIPCEIRECIQDLQDISDEEQRICYPSPNLTGIPGGKGTHGDPTAKTALSFGLLQNDPRVTMITAKIEKLRNEQNWLFIALDGLDRMERKVLELAYMGPRKTDERKRWNRLPTWKEIAYQTGYSESHIIEKAHRLLEKLSDLSFQQAILGMAAEKP